MAAAISERREPVDGLEVFWREAPPVGDEPVLYVHGVPTSSDDWLPFLERTGGVALDLPGFGRSGKPASFDYSIPGYARFLERFLEIAGLERFSLVAHDWGAVGLALAQRAPQRLERLVLFTCVPLLPGFRWHRVARIWRRPLLGELLMGTTTRWGFKRFSREATGGGDGLPDAFIDSFYRHFDHGTQRAILKLYRASPEDVLARGGERLADLSSPALILWPTEDPYVGTEFGQAYADALGGPVQLEMVERAGHWSWLDRPELIDSAADFLLAGAPERAAP